MRNLGGVLNEALQTRHSFIYSPVQSELVQVNSLVHNPHLTFKMCHESTRFFFFDKLHIFISLLIRPNLKSLFKPSGQTRRRELTGALAGFIQNSLSQRNRWVLFIQTQHHPAISHLMLFTHFDHFFGGRGRDVKLVGKNQQFYAECRKIFKV